MSWEHFAGTVPATNSHHASVRDRLSAAFRNALASSRSPAKELARQIDRTPKGAELILRGDVTPSVETLVRACREFDEVWEAFRDLCGRANTEGDAERLLGEIAERLRERRGV